MKEFIYSVIIFILVAFFFLGVDIISVITKSGSKNNFCDKVFKAIRFFFIVLLILVIVIFIFSLFI
jgi:hypothetical protein